MSAGKKLDKLVAINDASSGQMRLLSPNGDEDTDVLDVDVDGAAGMVHR